MIKQKLPVAENDVPANTVKLAISENLRQLSNGAIGRIPGWHGRQLYLGELGRQRWQNIKNHPNFIDLEIYGVREFCNAAVQNLVLTENSPQVMVSLGPGDGLPDRPIVGAIKQHRPELKYVPVDISTGLLKSAIDNLAISVPIPISIAADFETESEFIGQQLSKLAAYSRFFSMLGGTVSNLDGFESDFLRGLKDHVFRSGDTILFDIPLAGPNYCSSSEYLACVEHLGATSDQSSQRHAQSKEATPIGIKTVPNGSSIDGTTTIELVHRPTQLPIIKFRRYRWDNLIDWFDKEGFDFVYPQPPMQKTANDLESFFKQHPSAPTIKLQGRSYRRDLQFGVAVVLLKRR